MSVGGGGNGGGSGWALPPAGRMPLFLALALSLAFFSIQTKPQLLSSTRFQTPTATPWKSALRLSSCPGRRTKMHRQTLSTAAFFSNGARKKRLVQVSRWNLLLASISMRVQTEIEGTAAKEGDD